MTAVFERASRIALLASVAAIAAFQLAFHPDLTPALQRAGIVAAIVGLAAGWLASDLAIAFWIVAAPLCPALLRAATGLEGPVLDVVWMAGLAGALIPSSSWRTWHLPPLWRLLLGAWALTLALAWPIVVARELDFDWGLLRDESAVNSWAQLTAGRVVAWVLHVVQTQVLALLWFDWLVGRYHAAPDRTPRAVHALWIGVSAASLVAVYQGTVDLGFLSTPTWAGLRRATGTLLDANGFGALAAIAAPVACLRLRTFGHTWAGIALLAVNTAGLWMSGSRTALVGGVAGILGLVAALTIKPRQAADGRSRATGVAVVGLALAAVLAAAVLSGVAVGPLQRIAEVPLTRAGLVGLWDRGGYGTIALRMLRETPWTGVGPGMYHVLAPDYWRVMHDDTLPFDNAQNWWRHQAAELGVLGAAPVIAWSLLLAAGLVLSRPREGRSDAYLPRALLAGLGFASLLGIPTQGPMVLLWFFALTAWWAAGSSGTLVEGRLPATWTSWLAGGLLALAIAHACGTAVLARGWLRVPERSVQAHREYVSGAYSPEALAGGTPFRWTTGDARFLWAGPTPWMMLRIWVQHPDVREVPVRVTVATACQTLFDEELRSAEPISVGLVMPETQHTLQTTIRTSRTWQPAPQGQGDSRQLGAAIVSDFLSTRQHATEQNRVVNVVGCK